MIKPTIRLGYTDFWPGFDPKVDFFTRIIEKKFQIQWSNEPDFLIYSVFGFKHLEHRCVRIFYTGENVRPDFRDCDYAFSFDFLNSPYHHRLPYYVRRIANRDLCNLTFDAKAELARKTRFCTFVYSDRSGIRRNRFFEKLSKYKKVDSGGRLANNVGGRVADKSAFLQEGKFTIAFEHSCHDGYTTEKITDAFLAKTLPIYWGNPSIGRDFNAQRFLSAHDFSSDDELIERIIELDRDDSKYLAMMQKPIIPEQGNNFLNQDLILSQFDRIFSTPITPVAQRRAHLRTWDSLIRPTVRRVFNRYHLNLRILKNTWDASFERN